MSDESSKFLLSVIVPVYNVEEFLGECLASIVSQKFLGLEIIIVDDATKDNSKAIYRQYADKYQNIKIVEHLLNKAQGGARNSGAQIARGKWLLFLDSDDLICENSLQNIFRYLQAIDKKNSQNIDVIAAKRQFFTKTKIWIPKYIDNLYKKNRITTLKQNPQLLQDIYVCNKIWRRKLLEQNQIRFRENCSYEDIDFYVIALFQAEKILLSDEIMTKVRRYRGGSTTTVMQSNKIQQILTGYEIALKHIEHQKNQKNQEISRILLNRLFLNFVKPLVIPGFYISQQDKKLREKCYSTLKQKIAAYKQKQKILKPKYKFQFKTLILYISLNIIYALPRPMFDLFCRSYVRFYRFLLYVFGYLRQ